MHRNGHFVIVFEDQNTRLDKLQRICCGWLKSYLIQITFAEPITLKFANIRLMLIKKECKNAEQINIQKSCSD